MDIIVSIWQNKRRCTVGKDRQKIKRERRKSPEAFGQWLRQGEHSEGTVENYVRHTRMFIGWLDGRKLTREETKGWKTHLLSAGYCSGTVNTMLTSLNRYLDYIGREDCRVKVLRIQRKLFREESRELTKTEYEHLRETAYSQGKERLALLLETICSSGIRVSEVRYITVESARNGKAEISLKGKVRTILIPGRLAGRLLRYAKRQSITSGEIFITKKGKSLNRKQIWAEMKALCEKAGVPPEKVYPHNLRHLFARTFYGLCRDVAKLADVLGHTSIDTTRIYLISTGAEHARELERMQLLI